MKEVILCKYGEIILKGANKSQFESILLRDVRRRAAFVGNFDVRYAQSTVCIEPLSDFEDMEYACNRYGGVFGRVELVHKNKDTAHRITPENKVARLREMYVKLLQGPVDELKTEDIRANFENAVNSDFKIVIVAPMSSGKSTLINALLGANILPSLNQATTAVLTEIRDNDDLTEFVVSAEDKYGNVVVENEKATLALIKDLNGRKDPEDSEGKSALIRKICIEGPVPNLPSDSLKTVFVDTPGGNYSGNLEHTQLMDEAIHDENKSLILYVLDGKSIDSNDSNIILTKIANAMKDPQDGKLSRDRFLFVANRMDGFDPFQEPYESVIDNTILKFLGEQGITDPNLFLVSADAARLVRMSENNYEMTKREELNLSSYVDIFNDSSYSLQRYASISQQAKDKMLSEAREYVAAAEETDSRKEEEKLLHKAVELNSGIPALELKIREYLDKYALPIKIKSVHDSFMNKVNERRMIAGCEERWATSELEYDKACKELEQKRTAHEKSNTLKEMKERINAIKLDTSAIDREKANIIGAIHKIVTESPEKVEYEYAAYHLENISVAIKNKGKVAAQLLDKAVNDGVMESCRQIIKEYEEYIKELDKNGMFNVGAFNMKEKSEYKGFNIKKPGDLMNNKRYQEEDKKAVGTEKVKKSGFFAGLARFFGLGGYETVTRYKDQKYVKIKELVREEVTRMQNEFEDEIKKAIKNTEDKVETLKKFVERNAISRAEYERSLHSLMEKMHEG